MTFFHGIKVTTETTIRPLPHSSGTVLGLVVLPEKEQKTEEPKLQLVQSFGDLEALSGKAKEYVKAVYQQTRCKIVLLHISKPAEIEQLKFAEQKLGVTPNILLCPILHEKQEKVSDNMKPILSVLKTVSNSLKAVYIVDLLEKPTSSPKEMCERGIACWPPVLVSGDTNEKGELTTKSFPLSPFLAGVIAKNDSERGFHTSFSNREIQGILGLSADVDHSYFDSGCMSNQLNECKVVTVIPGPFRVWGNSGVFPEGKDAYKFVSVLRTEDQIQKLLVKGLQWAIDKNITRNFFEEVEVFVNNLLQTLRRDGVITNGEAWINKEKTTKEEITNGRVHISVKWTPSYIAQEILITQTLTDEFIKEILK